MQTKIEWQRSAEYLEHAALAKRVDLLMAGDRQ
jgi:hypothetical protein